MKQTKTATRVILGVLPAMALFATPIAAQDTVVAQPEPVQAAPVTVQPSAAPSAGPSAEEVARYQASLDAATGKPAARIDATPAARSARAGRPMVVRDTPQRASAPAAPRVAPATSVAPPRVALVPVAAPAVPVLTPAPPVAKATTPPAAPALPETRSSGSISWLLAGLAALVALAAAAILMRRRRVVVDDDAWADEPVVVNEAPAYEPVLAAPLAEEAVVEQADLVNADDAEVAAMTDAAAPVAGRPWIELSLRPVRAGATEDSALVDLELTLANAGAVVARDVHVSTFMLGDATAAPTDMDLLLAEGHAGTETDAGSIAAGEGSRIDARLAVPRDEVHGATFQPLVGIDVRYTLPDGTEGRTAAAFAVGIHDDSDEPTPFRLGGDMREDVSATLHGVPERV